MKKLFLFISTLILAMVLLVIISINPSKSIHSHQESWQSKIDIPFKLIEEKSSNEAKPLRSLKIFLPPESYSKNNLERIFCLFTQESISIKEVLTIYVFTDMDNLLQRKIDDESGFSYGSSGRPHNQPSKRITDRWPLHDAFFMKNSTRNDGITITEYVYSLNLNDPEATEKVVLVNCTTSN